MEKPFFDIDQSGMQVTVNSYKPGAGLAWQTLFPLKYTPKFDLKGLEGNEGIPVAADRVAFNSKAPKKTRKKIGSWSGKLAKYAVSREKDEIQIVEYRDLQTLAAANPEDKATARYLVDLVYDDVDFCNKAVNYKVEVDALRIGSSGFQVFDEKIDGDMTTEDVINFNVPAENFGGVKTAWSNADTADGIKDIADAQAKIVKKGLKKPMFAIIEKAKFEQLIAQKAVARRLYPMVADLSVITADMISIEKLNAYMQGKGYPQFLMLDSYATIEHKDGTQETIKPWAENVVTLSPTPQLGYTYYKTVPNVEGTAAIQTQGTFYKMTRYSEINPMLEVTMAEAYVQPALINRASLVFINTDKTSWK